MRNNPSSYSMNDIHRLNRADEHLHEAWQILNAEQQTVKHYKFTPKLAKLTARVWLLRQLLNTVKDDLQETIS